MSSRAMSLALAVAVLLLAGGAPAWSQEQAALPYEKCEVPLPDLEEPWTKQEEWVWTRVCEGEKADLNERKDGSRIDPEKKWELEDDRIISERFLKTILLRAPYREAIPENGVWIVGALFEEELDLSSARIDADLFIEASRFKAPVSFVGTEFKRHAGFIDSRFEKKLNLAAVHARKYLFLGEGAQFAEVNLNSANVDGNVVMRRARFTGPLHMDSIQVGGLLLMRDTEFVSVDLPNARIEGQVSTDGAKFTCALNMDGTQVGGSLYMRGTHFENELILFGSEISGALQFSNGEREASWGEGASLDLRQARLQVIEISEGSLPKKNAENPRPLKLEGLQYQRLVTYAGADEVNTWNADEYRTHWLEKSEFSSQAYKQLADALEREDRSDVAAEILYASKEKQWARAEGLRWFNLTLQKYLIGYGYRLYQALFWFGWFVGLGALVHLRVKAKLKQGLADLAASLFFSFDWLIPVLKLDEVHYEEPIPGWRRYYFGAHILIGFVLVSFILAGVSGLTK